MVIFDTIYILLSKMAAVKGAWHRFWRGERARLAGYAQGFVRSVAKQLGVLSHIVTVVRDKKTRMPPIGRVQQWRLCAKQLRGKSGALDHLKVRRLIVVYRFFGATPCHLNR
jgi:hypothetical protein